LISGYEDGSGPHHTRQLHAKTSLGLKIPPTVLVRAEKVIK
jgi:hypothetical protein